jgi:hypothetical protein
LDCYSDRGLVPPLKSATKPHRQWATTLSPTPRTTAVDFGTGRAALAQDTGREQELCIDNLQCIVLSAALAILGAAVKLCVLHLAEMEGPVRRQTHAHVKVDGLEAYALSPFAHLGVQMVGLVQDPEYVLAGVDGLE